MSLPAEAAEITVCCQDTGVRREEDGDAVLATLAPEEGARAESFVFTHDRRDYVPTRCRLPLVEERLRIRRPTKNGLDAPAVLRIDLSRRSSNVLLRAVACWSTEVRQVLDDRLRRRTFLLPIPPRTQLRPYHMVDSSAPGPCIDFENAR